MGVTGSGKSTFIQTASKVDSINVGHDFKSCTAEVVPYRFTRNGYDITLIDTPGFNDTLRSETEVLKEIAGWLDITYRKGMRLTGIIYLQALTDRKMYGSSLRNLKMFRDLCGDDPLKNIILGTTGWGTAEKSGEYEKAVDKEQQLVTDRDFWKPLIERGANVARFEDTEDSALSLIMSLSDHSPVTLKIQHELVDDGKDLIDTSAGATVNEEMKKLEAKYKAEMMKIQEEMDEALALRDQDMQEALEESKNTFERRLNEVQAEQAKLQYERRNEQRVLHDEIEETRLELKRATERQKMDHEIALQAQRLEDKMNFDQIVSKMRANEEDLRKEERAFLEQKIQELQAKPAKKGRGKSLLISCASVIGSVGMAALGFPMLGNPIGGLLNSIFDSDDTS